MNNFFFALNFCIIATTFPLHAADTTNILIEKFSAIPEYAPYVSWLPQHIKASLELTKACIDRNGEKDEEAKRFLGSKVLVDTVANGVNGDAVVYNYGTNSANIDAIREDMLIAIKNDFEQNKRRPRVLEIGPGHGFFSENIIIAGGNLTMIELQNSALAEAVANIGANVPAFLLSAEALDATFKAISGDIAAQGTLAAEEPFQYIVANNVMNFLTPEQFENMLDVAFSKLSKGGRLYLSGPSPHNQSQWTFYTEQAKKHVSYPGYMLCNKQSSKCLFPGEKRPGVVYGGRFYGDPELEVRHFFTAGTLSKKLKARGFTVLEAYFRDSNNQKIPSNGKIAMETQYAVCAIAQKM